jgi:hypothetical protein
MRLILAPFSHVRAARSVSTARRAVATAIVDLTI